MSTGTDFEHFKRYLHYGMDAPLYLPGDRFFLKCYTKERCAFLNKLIENGTPDEIIGQIVKVKKEGTSVYPDALIFTLALCVRLSKNDKLRAAAYRELKTVCPKPRDLFLFIKFFKDLNCNSGIGGGRGWKKAISQWYLSWMPLDLAQLMVKNRGYFGWTHKDVIKVAHVKATAPYHNLLLKYALKGINTASTEFADNQEKIVIEVIEYLKSVEKFKHLTDPDEASNVLQKELHSIEMISSPLLKHSVIWQALIPHMGLKDLLDNLERLSILGFLRGENPIVKILVGCLDNEWKIENCGLHPSYIFIKLLDYKNNAKTCLEMANILKHPISQEVPPKTPPKPNLLITNALMKLFYATIKLQKPTGLKYFVAIDVRPKMMTSRCWHCRHMHAVEAAALISICLNRVEPEGNVHLAAFSGPTGDDLVPLKVKKDSNIQEYVNYLREKESASSSVFVAKAIKWAMHSKKQVDMFVVISHNQVKTVGAHPALKSYQTEMNSPNTKVVTCSLNGKLKNYRNVGGKQMLCICGFDNKVCRLIDAFARDAF